MHEETPERRRFLEFGVFSEAAAFCILKLIDLTFLPLRHPSLAVEGEIDEVSAGV